MYIYTPYSIPLFAYVLHRQLVISDGRGESITGRTSPKAASMVASVRGVTLTLTATDLPPISVDLERISDTADTLPVR